MILHITAHITAVLIIVFLLWVVWHKNADLEAASQRINSLETTIGAVGGMFGMPTDEDGGFSTHALLTHLGRWKAGQAMALRALGGRR